MISHLAPGGRRKASLAAAIPAILFALAACTSGAPTTPPPSRAPSPPPPASTTTSTLWTPSAQDNEAACRRTDTAPWRPANEPYAGPGPHYIYPIEVQLDPGEPENAVDSKDLSTIARDMEIPRSRIPGGWQLIACVYDGQPTRRAGSITCHFDLGEPGTKTFPLYESRYEVIVREARTATLVTTLDLPGTTPDADSCPRLVLDKGDTIILRGLDGHTLGEALRPAFLATK